jgi:putative Mg2+ transporter-C (MgtC) family protein
VLGALHFPSEWELVGRIFLAMALVAPIGLEREISGHPAGFRTHLTLALGAVLFGLVSAYGFAGFLADRNSNNYQVDVTRVASQIVVGVGFLGGGAILKEGATVRGLTTAASLWVTAAIALACAMGLYVLASVTAGAVLLGLVGLRGATGWMDRHIGSRRETVVIRLRPGAPASAVMAALDELPDVDVRSMTVNLSDGAWAIRVRAESAGTVKLSSALVPIGERDDVVGLDIG